MNKSELRKISINYRTLSSQMLKIENENEVGYIKTFVNLIESTPIIYNYLKLCHTKDYNIAEDMKNNNGWGAIVLPTKTEDLIDYVYQILKLIVGNEKLLFSWSFQYTTSNKYVDKYKAFMRKTIEPFVHLLRNFWKFN